MIGGWFLYDPIFLRAQNDPWGVGLLIALGVAIGVGFFELQNRRSDRARRYEERRLRESGESTSVTRSDSRFQPDRSWVAPAVIIAAWAGFGFLNGQRARDNYVLPYCLYGAQSRAQLDGCMSHVTSNEINELETQAARFARGETSDCLDDSGPFCADASKWNALDPSDYQ